MAFCTHSASVGKSFAQRMACSVVPPVFGNVPQPFFAVDLFENQCYAVMTALLWIDLQRRDMAECHALLCCSSTVCGDSQKQSSLTRRCGACRKRKALPALRLRCTAWSAVQYAVPRKAAVHPLKYSTRTPALILQLALRYTLCAAARPPARQSHEIHAVRSAKSRCLRR